MKKSIFMIVLGLMALAYASTAQTSFTFTYDASGNRVSRTISLKSASIAPNDTVVAKQTRFEDLIGNWQVKIYPNPTKGRLKVEIPFSDELVATIGVYSLQGALVKKLEVNRTFTEIDLSNQPPGVYLLRISISDSTSEWKVVKE